MELFKIGGEAMAKTAQSGPGNGAKGTRKKRGGPLQNGPENGAQSIRKKTESKALKRSTDTEQKRGQSEKQQRPRISPRRARRNSQTRSSRAFIRA